MNQKQYSKGSYRPIGYKHQWLGGSLQYWKEAAKLRDNDTCQVCGLYEPAIMQVDHIKPIAVFPELKKDLTNMLTLCPNCHVRKTNQDLKRYNLITGRPRKHKQ